MEILQLCAITQPIGRANTQASSRIYACEPPSDREKLFALVFEINSENPVLNYSTGMICAPNQAAHAPQRRCTLENSAFSLVKVMQLKSKLETIHKIFAASAPPRIRFETNASSYREPQHL